MYSMSTRPCVKKQCHGRVRSVPQNTVAKDSGETACTACGKGESTAGEGSTVCTEVPRGFYVNASNDTVKCEPGYKCEGKDSDREACTPGHYAQDEGSISCIACPPGRASKNNATVECALCPENTVAKDSGETACTACGKGESLSLIHI